MPYRVERGLGAIRQMQLLKDVADVRLNSLLGDSKFEGTTNSVRIRQAIRQAREDTAVKAIMLNIDSPGGTVNGTEELAREVQTAGLVKPLVAHIDGMGASAAFWVAAQAGRITASQTSEIGSIGVLGVVEDTSEAAELLGVKVHVIVEGKHKGEFVDGAPVSQESLDHLQTLVTALFGMFLKAVADGRSKMSMGDVRKVADGRTMLAKDALAAGLIDAVSSFDEALAALVAKVDGIESRRAARQQRAAIGR